MISRSQVSSCLPFRLNPPSHIATIEELEKYVEWFANYVAKYNPDVAVEVTVENHPAARSGLTYVMIAPTKRSPDRIEDKLLIVVGRFFDKQTQEDLEFARSDIARSRNEQAALGVSNRRIAVTALLEAICTVSGIVWAETRKRIEPLFRIFR